MRGSEDAVISMSVKGMVWNQEVIFDERACTVLEEKVMEDKDHKAN